MKEIHMALAKPDKTLPIKKPRLLFKMIRKTEAAAADPPPSNIKTLWKFCRSARTPTGYRRSICEIPYAPTIIPI